MTQEDIKRFCDKAKEFSENLTPDEAKDFLADSGIYDEQGNLLPPYSGETSKP